MTRLLLAGAATLALISPVAAQDSRALERCLQIQARSGLSVDAMNDACYTEWGDWLLACKHIHDADQCNLSAAVLMSNAQENAHAGRSAAPAVAQPHLPAPEWINNCMQMFEGPGNQTAELSRMTGKPIPTHYENRQYCIGLWNGSHPDEKIRDKP